MPGDRREVARELAEAISEALSYAHAIRHDPTVVEGRLDELEAALGTIIELVDEYGANVQTDLDLDAVGARARTFLHVVAVRPVVSAALQGAAVEFLRVLGLANDGIERAQEAQVDPADLNAVFEQFKAGLADAGPPTPETHYDLGVAYAEMGLMEDAIAELELAAEAGHEGAKLKLRELRGGSPPDDRTLH